MYLQSSSCQLCCIQAIQQSIRMTIKSCTGKLKIFSSIVLLSVIFSCFYSYRQTRTRSEESKDVLFIYHEVMNVHKSKNNLAIKQLREEILENEMADSERYLILSQENTPLHTKVSYYLPGLSRYTTLDDGIWSSLPKVSPFAGKHFKRCSLVGNGGILTNSSCGHEIDAADFVFRCNLAPIQMFTKDAGFKTNFTTMNPTIIETRYNKLSDSSDVMKMNADISQHHGLLWVPCFAYSGSESLCEKIIANYNNLDPKLVIGHPDHYRSIQTFWKKKDQSDRLSTGFYLLSTAIQLCDEVHLFGFWPFDFIVKGKSVEKIPYHYYDNLDRTSFHTFNKEFHSLLKFHLEGVLNLHSHHCQR